jgi:hypothetical protein
MIAAHPGLKNPNAAASYGKAPSTALIPALKPPK